MWVSHEAFVLLMRLLGFSSYTLSLNLRYLKELFFSPQNTDNYVSIVSAYGKHFPKINGSNILPILHAHKGPH